MLLKEQNNYIIFGCGNEQSYHETYHNIGSFFIKKIINYIGNTDDIFLKKLILIQKYIVDNIIIYQTQYNISSKIIWFIYANKSINLSGEWIKIALNYLFQQKLLYKSEIKLLILYDNFRKLYPRVQLFSHDKVRIDHNGIKNILAVLSKLHFYDKIPLIDNTKFLSLACGDGQTIGDLANRVLQIRNDQAQDDIMMQRIITQLIIFLK